jgi:hypothetical protein
MHHQNESLEQTVDISAEVAQARLSVAMRKYPLVAN